MLTPSERSSRTTRKSPPPIITIDGPAGVGKSTAAKLLAKRLGLWYLDTGATYRALAYASLIRGIDPSDARRVARLARGLRIVVQQSPRVGFKVLLNRRDVTRRIRTERVTDAAAVIAQHPRVRVAMVRLQRQLARAEPVVVEGRDTGSVVFPQAPYKFFLTATTQVRARRRQMELQSVQGRSPALSVIAKQLRVRDRLDRRRKVGPLVRPPKAVVLDTSHLDAPEVVQRMLRYLSAVRQAGVSDHPVRR